MEHHFNTTIAKEVGVISAIIANNIKFWIDKNIANRKHFINGRYWTYNSITALQELFDYLSPKQIRSAIDRLVAEGYLVKGDFSENRFNRPTWYSLEDKYYETIGENRSYVIPQGETSCPTGQTIVPPQASDIRSSYSKPNIKQEGCDDFFADDDKDADLSGTNNTPPSNNNVTNITSEEFVALYHQICPTLPKVSKLTNKRRDAIKRRIREMGDMATITNVLKKLNNSDFCRGVNQNKWKADFDWLVKNDTIWVWILEGKYDNKGTTFSPAYNAPQQAPITEITDF
ncbi:MAG TPA: hypothetical protein P5523_07870 [Bacteroidales bacterium]|nr:hypothetical protein [Bacteroidales bacterium]